MENKTMRNPWLWGAGLVLLVALGIAYAAGWMGGDEPMPAQPAVQQTE
jgi:hypothetical protein